MIEVGVTLAATALIGFCWWAFYGSCSESIILVLWGVLAPDFPKWLLDGNAELVNPGAWSFAAIGLFVVVVGKRTSNQRRNLNFALFFILELVAHLLIDYIFKVVV